MPPSHVGQTSQWIDDSEAPCPLASDFSTSQTDYCFSLAKTFAPFIHYKPSLPSSLVRLQDDFLIWLIWLAATAPWDGWCHGQQWTLRISCGSRTGLKAETTLVVVISKTFTTAPWTSWTLSLCIGLGCLGCRGCLGCLGSIVHHHCSPRKTMHWL